MHGKRIGLVAAVAALAMTGSAGAATPPYRTDKATEQYLEHGLRSWAGINLRKADFVFAFCINGAYSAFERRTGHHYGEKMNAVGEYLFRSFSCSLSANGRNFHLYLLTRVGTPGWSVRVDR